MRSVYPFLNCRGLEPVEGCVGLTSLGQVASEVVLTRLGFLDVPVLRYRSHLVELSAGRLHREYEQVVRIHVLQVHVAELAGGRSWNGQFQRRNGFSWRRGSNFRLLIFVGIRPLWLGRAAQARTAENQGE